MSTDPGFRWEADGISPAENSLPSIGQQHRLTSLEVEVRSRRAGGMGARWERRLGTKGAAGERAGFLVVRTEECLGGERVKPGRGVELGSVEN